MSQTTLKKKLRHLRNKKEILLHKAARIEGLIQSIENELDDPYLQCDQGPGVYLLRCQDLYKIGRADDLRNRIATLQTGCPYPISIELFFPCDLIDAPLVERELHNHYSHKKHLREWYRLSKRDVAKLKEAELNNYIRCGLKAFSDFINAPETKEDLETVILSTIKHLCNGSGLKELAKKEDIISECNLQEFSRYDAEYMIAAMRLDGRIIEQRFGLFRVP